MHHFWLLRQLPNSTNRMEFIRKAIRGGQPDHSGDGPIHTHTEPDGAANNESKSPGATLLVLQADAYDWSAIFRGCRLRDGRAVEVVQTGWDKIRVSSNSPRMSPNVPIIVDVKPDPDSPPSRDASCCGGGARTIRPDFVLVRNEVRGAAHTEDYRNSLFGMMFAGLPSVNTLSSVYSFLERPIVQAELNEMERRLGSDRFPVIPQSYFSSHSAMMYGGQFPCVAQMLFDLWMRITLFLFVWLLATLLLVA